MLQNFTINFLSLFNNCKHETSVSKCLWEADQTHSRHITDCKLNVIRLKQL